MFPLQTANMIIGASGYLPEKVESTSDEVGFAEGCWTPSGRRSTRHCLLLEELLETTGGTLYNAFSEPVKCPLKSKPKVISSSEGTECKRVSYPVGEVGIPIGETSRHLWHLQDVGLIS